MELLAAQGDMEIEVVLEAVRLLVRLEVPQAAKLVQESAVDQEVTEDLKAVLLVILAVPVHLDVAVEDLGTLEICQVEEAAPVV